MPRKFFDKEQPSKFSELEEFALDIVKKAGIGDLRILRALTQIDRKDFVLPANRDRAYFNEPLPLLTGKDDKIATISQPTLVIKMIDHLRLQPGSHVLEIGTGSGYSAALMSQLCKHVTTIEYIPELAQKAKERLKKLNLRNITVLQGDGAKGYAKSAPYNMIVSTVGLKDIPQAYINQLAEGGRMIVPVGEDIFALSLILGEKRHGKLGIMEVGEVQYVPIITDNERIGWSKTTATALLGLESESEPLTLDAIARDFGIDPKEYKKHVRLVFGYRATIPQEQLEGLAGWIVSLRTGVEPRNLVGKL